MHIPNEKELNCQSSVYCLQSDWFEAAGCKQAKPDLPFPSAHCFSIFCLSHVTVLTLSTDHVSSALVLGFWLRHRVDECTQFAAVNLLLQ